MSGRLVDWRRSGPLALACLTFGVAFAFTYGPDAIRMDLGPSLLISLLAALAVWASGRWPIGALVVCVIAIVALVGSRSTFDAMPLVVAFVGFQAVMRTNRSLAMLGAVLASSLITADLWSRHLLQRPYAETSIVFPVLMTALIVGLGWQGRRMREQHDQLVALRDADRVRVVLDERRRIARDVHDVAAHHLSALVVRNKLARRVGTIEALADAADFSSQTASDALDSLRRVVSVLSTEGHVPLDPQPTFADLQDVANRMTGAGLHIEESIGDLPPTGRDVEIAAVRIVQEALSNVLRHRGPGRAWLQVGRSGDDIKIVVEDDGVADAPPASGEHHPGRTGQGIIGMRERAEACGGSVLIGASPRGGWLVAATLPTNT